MLFKTETPWSNTMSTLATCHIKSPIVPRTRLIKKKSRVAKKPCMKNADVLDCAIRHRRCDFCPFNDFFKPQNIIKYTPPDIDND